MSRQSFPIKDERMGVNDAPQWLISAFIRSCQAAGATAPRAELEAAFQRLLERWASSGRFHHNIKHLVDVLAKVDQLAEETHDPDLVRLAAWYHGAVFSSTPSSAYAQRGGEDEVASADFADSELRALGLPERNADRVREIITGIARHRGGGDIDIQALCDAELATLAVEPQRYASYRRDVRAEYAHIPTRDYLTSRIAILTKLLGRKRLFASPLGQPWEDPARQNLIAELQQLREELEALPPDSPSGEGAEAGADAGSPGGEGEEPGQGGDTPGRAGAEDGAAREKDGARSRDGGSGSASGSEGEDLASGNGSARRTEGPRPARGDDTATTLGRVQAPGTFGRSSAEAVADARRDTAPIIKRYEKTTERETKREDLPGRS